MPVEERPDAGEADADATLGLEPLGDLGQRDVLGARLDQGEDEVGVRVEPGTARLALAARRRLAIRPEAPDPDDRRRRADTEAGRRLPRRNAVGRCSDHATAQVAAIGLNHRHLPNHQGDGIRKPNQREAPTNRRSAKTL